DVSQFIANIEVEAKVGDATHAHFDVVRLEAVSEHGAGGGARQLSGVDGRAGDSGRCGGAGRRPGPVDVRRAGLCRGAEAVGSAGRVDGQGRAEDRVQDEAVTWQWVVLILAFMALLGFQSYVNVLKARTDIAARSLGMDTPAAPTENRNGSS